MELGWLESILFGFLSGLTDILPVSSQAHKLLLLKLFGAGKEPNLLKLLIHIGIFAAIYYNYSAHIIRFIRAKRLSRIPKRKRKRPLDTKSLMDYSLLKTMLIPVILALFFYRKAAALSENLILVACFLLINGIILYVPQFLPGSNKDSRMLSRLEGLLMGLGGAVSILPGISAIGSAASVGAACGVDRDYGLNMAMLLNLGLLLGVIVLDIIGAFTLGFGYVTFLVFVQYLLVALGAFGGAFLGITLLKHIVTNNGFGPFALYCWGLALFTFVLNLIA